MFMCFSSKAELRTFLANVKDWRKWFKDWKKNGDRVFVKEEPMVLEDVEKLMQGN